MKTSVVVRLIQHVRDSALGTALFAAMLQAVKEASDRSR
jgi:hypothetical protein